MPSPLLLLPHTYRAFYGAFPHLHPVQLQAIEPLLDGRDVVIQSATGSGKTEAVLAPCLEHVIRSGREAAVVYVVPTRALAIDLERRISPILTERLGLRLSIRTGDVKRAGGGRPDLLLTTPESLDVAVGSANPDVRGFMKRVRTVIIDEAHPLVHTYRGRQLACLLRRLERRTGGPLQKVALSATIADMDALCRFFEFRPDAAHLIEPVQREIVPHLVHLKQEDHEFLPLLDDLYDRWGYRKILVFANSRGRCDRLFGLLSGPGRFHGVAGLHYSNLKPKERQRVERRFRTEAHALCIATSTLELGIDIGDVDAVLLYEPPDSVAAFLQRIGRSNRRQSHTHVWGVCRGERASLQALRFLGLLRLARQGVMEKRNPGPLSSVLIQQILSCLYEKRRLSRSALQDLFPECAEELAALFPVLLQQGWLRQEKVAGLVRGGRRYRDWMLEQRIWSNFPEQEDDYGLELSGEAVADLPASLVKQLTPGDRVLLTGKRMQILQIDAGPRKHVVAVPSAQVDDKDLFWLGAGFRVSYEVAQAMREVIRTPEEAPDGLFARTRRLLQSEQTRHDRRVTLANGIEVSRSAARLYYYHTFLGSLGNLILGWTIEHTHADRDLMVTFDEVGVECSEWIDFQTLNLPTDREMFREWAERHLEELQTLFPLNAFCAALPQDLLVEEVSGLLFDPRIADAFMRYRADPSQIVSGDPSVLEQDAVEAAPRAPEALDAPHTDPLLTWEKQRWEIDGNGEVTIPLEAQYRPRSLTGAMVGEYMRHQQCERWLSFNFLPEGQRPSARTRENGAVDTLRTEAGRRHETRTLEHIRTYAATLAAVEEKDAVGGVRPVQERFQETLERLRRLIHRVERGETGVFFITHPVLVIQDILEIVCLDTPPQGIDGVGVPDLIRIKPGTDGLMLEVGDIKDSIAPYESQKWQVAFYALLLDAAIRSGTISADIKVAPTGFLITRPRPGEQTPDEHPFDLGPYLAAFPALLRNIARLLLRPPGEAGYRLQTHCATCPWFEYCYRQALATEDIQFLPHLSQGALIKLRTLGLRTLKETKIWFEQQSVPESFSPHQRELLTGHIESVSANRIFLRERRTRLFPVNLSSALLVEVLENPVVGMPCGIGLCVVHHDGATEPLQIWIAREETEWPAVLRAFSDVLIEVWRRSVHEGQGPHVFHFGERCARSLRFWGADTGLSFLWTGSHLTDLRRALTDHFDVSAPGTLTLFAAGRMLGLKPGLPAPESLYHPDAPAMSSEEWTDGTLWPEKAVTHLRDALSVQSGLWCWISAHLISEWDQNSWDTASDTPEHAYLDFLEEERRRREEDILALQAYSLPERVDRFRAIGPMTFSDMHLDEEGRPLYRFQIPQEAGLSKFREGDFLKLAPTGTVNLQEGFPVILSVYDRHDGTLCVRARQGRPALSKRLAYSLEEDLTDWNGPKLVHAVHAVFSGDRSHPLARLFEGRQTQPQNPADARWIEAWLRKWGEASGLNPAQQAALSLPFRFRMGLIEGPPGTGKTHLLAWTLIALIAHARDRGAPMRIAVGALTHQAIDNVLTKVAELVNAFELRDFSGRLFKWGRGIDPVSETESGVEPLTDAEELAAIRYAVVGATGFGLYQLFEGQKGLFPAAFDWVVMDEASQNLIPQALLSLLYGKGPCLFYGDVHQLPPIVLGDYDEAATKTGVHRSVLQRLLDLYGEAHRIRLDRTYRMNRELCAFPSRTWYDGALHPAPANMESRLTLPGTRRQDIMDRALDPDQPVTMILTDHQGCHQQSDLEADIMADLAYRLLVEHRLNAADMALISPHRAQNNAITVRLVPRLDPGAPLPLIDTVERVQGAERDIIIYGFTTSDPDHVMSEFLNNPNRFNVAITRARKKLIVIGSRTFFSTVPHEEETLKANACFKAFAEFCRDRQSLIVWPGD